jgi:soluble lytic murein transglycosylase
MRNYPISKLLSMLLLSCLPLYVAAKTNGSVELQNQRQLFQEALQALNKGQTSRFTKLYGQLQDYPLHSYLRYRQLGKQLGSSSNQEIHDFLTQNDDAAYARSLRKQWLRLLARRGQWQTYVQEYRPGRSTTLHCYYLQARIKTGQTEDLLREIEKVWLVGKSQPHECDPVFAWWRQQGAQTHELTWARIGLAMEKRKLSLASYLAKSLPQSEQIWVSRWQQMHRRPKQELQKSVYRQDNDINRKIVIHGIVRLARIDAEAAYREWQSLRGQYNFSTDQLGKADRRIAMSAAYQRKSQAHNWLGMVSKDGVDEDVREWRIRTAIGNQAWESVSYWIEQLPAEERETPHWQYWLARAMEESGKPQEARLVYARVATDRGYHGFMAADHIGLPYALNHRPVLHTEQELKDLENIPAIARSREFYFNGLTSSARREWRQATSNFDQRQLQLAAVLAHRWSWHDRAIFTTARAKYFDDLEMRFPVVYRKEVERHANRQQIDPAWVMGVMRQESAYMQDARSHAGAMGLMQLMPQTARSVARLIKTPLRRTSELLNADKNILLGTAYLRRVLDKNNGHQVLATASYNAGPHRVQAWLPEKENGKLAADIWVETMPFSETRTYVKRVMAYTTIFEKQLGRSMTPMKNRMPDVRPRG